MARRKVEIPKRILSVVERCRLIGCLTKTLPLAYAGETQIHWTFADGSEAPDLNVRQAIERGLIIPAGDGLFGSEMSQTYRAA